MLHLTAADEADLAVISAQMQDALIQRADLRYDAKRRRFILLANRFAWDALPEKQRRRAGLHFDDVKAVRVLGLEKAKPDAVLSLLAITFTNQQSPEGMLDLHFAAGIKIQFDVAAINATLDDLGGVWSTAQVPAHSA